MRKSESNQKTGVTTPLTHVTSMKSALRILTSFFIGYFLGWGVADNVFNWFPLMQIELQALIACSLAIGLWSIHFFVKIKS